MSDKKEIAISDEELEKIVGGEGNDGKSYESLLRYTEYIFGSVCRQWFNEGGPQRVYDNIVAALGPGSQPAQVWKKVL